MYAKNAILHNPTLYKGHCCLKYSILDTLPAGGDDDAPGNRGVVSSALPSPPFSYHPLDPSDKGHGGVLGLVMLVA